MAAFDRRRFPIRHCDPAGSRLSCPSVTDVSKAGPSWVGASHNDGERAHNQTQATCPFSGSCSPTLQRPHPHDHTDAMPVSPATWRNASACHFATWNHAETGSRPLRPPKPFVVAKLTIRPTLSAGIPIEVRFVTALR